MDLNVLPLNNRAWRVEPVGGGIALISGHHILARYCNAKGVGTPYLTGPSDFAAGQIFHSKYTTRPSAFCEPADILITVKGSGSGTIVYSDNRYCISRQLMALRSRNWIPKFLYYSLIQTGGKIADASTGLIPGLSRSDICEQLIPVPPISEQRAIAEALSDADALIAALDALIAKKRDLKRATMQQLLTGKTRLVGFTKEWRRLELGSVAKFYKGKGLPKSAISRTGAHPCIHYGELFTHYGVLINTILSRTDFNVGSLTSRRNDVLMPTSDVTPNGLAKASCLKEEGIILGGDILIIRPEERDLDGVFLASLIRYDFDQIMRRNRSHPPGQAATWAGIVGSRLLARAAVMRAQA